jgi:3-methyladenine DNA glycosylase AlkC
MLATMSATRSSAAPAVPLRKGARSRAAIPPAVLQALNHGHEETRSLSEWLAIDQAHLAAAVLPGLIGVRAAQPALAAATAVAGLGILQRVRGIGAALADRSPTQLRKLACHGSDTVRGWACVAVMARPGRSLAERLTDVRVFATDAHFGVREWAWMELRPQVALDVPAALALLQAWAADEDPNIRRCACEATRPRGVWCAHLKDLLADPRPAEPLLTALRADPARYVQLSLGNWLNDAGKTHPDWLAELAARWRREAPGTHTEAILRRGLRRFG